MTGALIAYAACAFVVGCVLADLEGEGVWDSTCVFLFGAILGPPLLVIGCLMLLVTGLLIRLRPPTPTPGAQG